MLPTGPRPPRAEPGRGTPTVFGMGIRRLVYLYVGSSDVGRDLGFHRDGLGRLRAAGWAEEVRRVEVPDGPCAILVDPSGNEVALLERVRPGVMEGRRG